MVAKKKASQIRRMKLRAQARGEEYEVPQVLSQKDTTATATTTSSKEKVDAEQEGRKNQQLVQKIASRLRRELNEADNDKDLNAKARRSAKRKAEAIAVEESGCTLEELMSLDVNRSTAVEASSSSSPDETSRNKRQKKSLEGESKEDYDTQQQSQHLPYVLFVGQISYTTTAESLLHHFKRGLSQSNHSKALISNNNIQIRLLTDQKTKKSKGMAFVEVDTPELLYECLKLHRSQLDGRRINVERTVGGGKKSARRKERIEELRKEQQEYISQTVDHILYEYAKDGYIQLDPSFLQGGGQVGDDSRTSQHSEFDDGVIRLLKRHSCATVERALQEYVEEKQKDASKGRSIDNPSAYLTHIVTRIASEEDQNGPSQSKNTKPRNSTSKVEDIANENNAEEET